jgi:tetratricopeptide (TPR) repeat protein
MAGAGLSRAPASSPAPPATQPAKITIDYPLNGSVFPPEITSPTFLWRDSSGPAQRWRVQVSFADRSEPIRVDAPGEHLQIGENQLGTVLAKMGRMGEAVAQLQKAISLAPASVEYQYNFGFVLMLRKDSTGAVPAFQKAVELSVGKDPRCLAALADAYEKTGHSTQTIQSAQQALDLAIQGHDLEMEKNLRAALERYERDGAKAQPR